MRIAERRRAVLDRRIDNVGDRLAHHQAISGDDNAGGRVDRDAFFGENAERLRAATRELTDIDRAAREPDGTRISI